MQLVSEVLLRREIRRYEESPELMGKNEMFYFLCKKELAVIEKLKINKIDMRGEIEESNRRIENQSIYFMDSQEFKEMESKSKMYDIIVKLIKENDSE